MADKLPAIVLIEMRCGCLASLLRGLGHDFLIRGRRIFCALNLIRSLEAWTTRTACARLNFFRRSTRFPTRSSSFGSRFTGSCLRFWLFSFHLGSNPASWRSRLHWCRSGALVFLVVEVWITRWISIRRRTGEEEKVDFSNEGPGGTDSFRESLAMIREQP